MGEVKLLGGGQLNWALVVVGVSLSSQMTDLHLGHHSACNEGAMRSPHGGSPYARNSKSNAIKVATVSNSISYNLIIIVTLVVFVLTLVNVWNLHATRAHGPDGF